LPVRHFWALLSVAQIGSLFPLVVLFTSARGLEGVTGINRYFWVGLASVVFSCISYPVVMAYRSWHPKTRDLPPPSMRRYLALGLVCLVGLLLLAVLRYEVSGP